MWLLFLFHSLSSLSNLYLCHIYLLPPLCVCVSYSIYRLPIESSGHSRKSYLTVYSSSKSTGKWRHWEVLLLCAQHCDLASVGERLEFTSHEGLFPLKMHELCEGLPMCRCTYDLTVCLGNKSRLQKAKLLTWKKVSEKEFAYD